MRPGERAANRQAKPEAVLFLPLAVPPVVPLENERGFFSGNAFAVVDDVEDELVGLPGDHFDARRCCGHAVVEQIQQNLFEMRAVSDSDDFRLGQRDFDGGFGKGRQGADLRDDLLQQAGELDFLLFRVDSACLHRGKVEQVVDHRLQPLCFIHADLHELVSIGAFDDPVLYSLYHPANRRHRGAQLVGDSGQQVCAHPLQLPQPLGHVSERGDELADLGFFDPGGVGQGWLVVAGRDLLRCQRQLAKRLRKRTRQDVDQSPSRKA